MDQIALFFKCQSCSDYALTGNIQCPNGHQVCQACFENLSHCPTCNQRVAPSTRIPFLLTANVDPILNVGDSFDLLLPSLLRIAPVLSPCGEDEMIFVGKTANNPNSCLMNSMLLDDESNSMQQNNTLTDQLMMANNCEVEETLSRLMMLASMSPGPSQPVNQTNIATSKSNNVSNPNSTIPPPGLVSSSSTSAAPNHISGTQNNQTGASINQQQQRHQQQIENFVEF